jgi:hypothetical protein
MSLILITINTIKTYANLTMGQSPLNPISFAGEIRCNQVHEMRLHLIDENYTLLRPCFGTKQNNLIHFRPHLLPQFTTIYTNELKQGMFVS